MGTGDRLRPTAVCSMIVSTFAKSTYGGTRAPALASEVQQHQYPAHPRIQMPLDPNARPGTHRNLLAPLTPEFSRSRLCSIRNRPATGMKAASSAAALGCFSISWKLKNAGSSGAPGSNWVTFAG